MSKPAQKAQLRTWPWILLGGIGTLGLFGGIGTWAATSQIAGAIVALGTVGAESRIKTIQHLEGGIVGEILVQDGDLVKVGALLVRLDDTSKRANHAIVTGHLHEQEASLARLRAERDGTKTIVFPQHLLKKKNDPAVDAMIRGQVSLFDIRQKGKHGQIKIFRQRIVQLIEQIKGLNTQRKAKQEQTDILGRSIERKSIAARNGIVSGDTMDTIRRQKSELTGDIGDLLARVAQARGSIKEIELQILQVDKEFRENVLSEIRQNQTSSGELREKSVALQEQLRRIDIRAPQAGRIHNMSIFTVGGVISPAKPILQIIPANANLIIETKIEPKDVDQIKVGQSTAVHLSAFDARTTPVLDGKVKNVSAAQMVDTATQQSYFTVEILISKDQLERLTDGQELLPGMPAEVFIATGERTPLNYFLKPLIVQFQRAFKEE
ncbi:MAG: HlyD family type I secretion periplasmic adaptor subunit [bacterium]|nr:HlyD family type I secretion periplasmic adaptor subunit [bacterium]